MAFCVYYRFNLLAVEKVPALVLDEGIAARYPPVLYAYERGASTARRPKSNAVISFAQADLSISTQHSQNVPLQTTFNEWIGS